MTPLGIGEIAPTAGLPPRARDLFAPRRGPTLEGAICAQLSFADIEIVETGTAALYIALTFLKRQSPRRTKVIIPAYTCPLVVRMIAATGLQAVPCDTVAGGFDLDLEDLTGLVDRDTLAVLPTHYGGLLTDVARLRAVLSSGISIVEDAAQAFGATEDGQSVGRIGDIGAFSFGVGKGLTIYRGGALIATDPEVMAGLRAVAAELTSHSALAEAWRALLFAGYHALYNPLGLRAFYGARKRFWLARGDEIRAAGDNPPFTTAIPRVGPWRKAVGRAALARLPAHLARSRERFGQLCQHLGMISGLKVHVPAPGSRPTATFVFVTLPAAPATDGTIRRLWASRLGVAKMFSRSIVDYPELRPFVLDRPTPHARALAATTITLSTHSSFTPEAEAAVLSELATLGQVSAAEAVLPLGVP
jgi:dTDP-4-amino-4,6-dideoxygalactose transaminase